MVLKYFQSHFKMRIQADWQHSDHYNFLSDALNYFDNPKNYFKHFDLLPDNFKSFLIIFFIIYIFI